MNVMLMIAIGLVVLALLGFTGMIAALRSAAWLILVVAVIVVVLTFVF